MNEQILRSKFLGALIGTGVGDALGAPFEGRRLVEFDARHSGGLPRAAL